VHCQAYYPNNPLSRVYSNMGDFGGPAWGAAQYRRVPPPGKALEYRLLRNGRSPAPAPAPAPAPVSSPLTDEVAENKVKVGSAALAVATLPRIDVEQELFPYSITWTPIPMITWCCPCIGHMGICDSDGVIYDFAGPYYIGADHMAFGRPARYLQLDPAKMVPPPDSQLTKAEHWDAMVHAANRTYTGRMHNLCCDNCHSHVALALNRGKYDGLTGWNMIWLAAWMFFCGQHVTCCRTMGWWLPFLVIMGIVLALTMISSPPS